MNCRFFLTEALLTMFSTLTVQPGQIRTVAVILVYMSAGLDTESQIPSLK